MGIEPVAQHSKQIENAGVHGSDLVGMVIPQNPVNVSDRFSNVVTVSPIDRPQPLTSMDVVERNRSRSERNCRDRIYETDRGGCRSRTEQPTTA